MYNIVTIMGNTAPCCVIEICNFNRVEFVFSPNKNKKQRDKYVR